MSDHVAILARPLSIVEIAKTTNNIKFLNEVIRDIEGIHLRRGTLGLAWVDLEPLYARRWLLLEREKLPVARVRRRWWWPL